MSETQICHQPGRHCGSTAIADLANYHGIKWSEAFCFGMGGGLGLFYANFPGMSPSRLVHVRSTDFERNAFTRLGQSFRWQTAADPAVSERDLRLALDDGRPAVVQTDIFYLPYYESSTHFPGHLIAVWGYDDAAGVFLVTDTERPALLEVPYAAMRDARHSKKGPFPLQGQMFAPATLSAPDDLPSATLQAIVANSRSLLGSRIPVQGVRALETWIAELPQWAEFPDWQWTARFAYQLIEKRGTGGGAFRLMYSEFLDEASDDVPAVKQLGLASQMRELASLWTDTATAFKKISEGDRPMFEEARSRLKALLEHESAYHRLALQVDEQR
ncbi:MAG: BtrH N-terminal domain-containing protein [Pseudomonadota bacterium]|nr:BtrH N-terminal domain-containing protein [Pseudomonadota bacterium]